MPSARTPSVAALLLAASWAGCVAPGNEAASEARVASQVRCLDPCAALLAGPHVWQQEGPIAVHPLDPNFRVVVSYEERPDMGRRGAWFSAMVTHDGGGTWKRHPLPGGLTAPPDHPLAGKDHARYPSVAITEDGAILVAGTAFLWAPQIDRPLVAFVARSGDGGESFDVTFRYGEGVELAGASVAKKEGGGWGTALAAGTGGQVLLAFFGSARELRVPRLELEQESGVTGVFASRSTDGGRTWSPIEVVAFSEVANVGMPRLAFGSDGAEYVLYHDRGDVPQAAGHVPSPSFLKLAARAPGASEWTTSELGLTAAYAGLALERRPGGDRLLLASGEIVGALDDVLVRSILRTSDDGGRTWSAPITIQEPEHHGQPYPLVAADDRGTVFATLYHAVSPRGDLEYRAFTLRDGAVGAPIVLGTAHANGDMLNFGHAMGLVPIPGGVAAAWIQGEATELWAPENRIELMTATLEGPE